MLLAGPVLRAGLGAPFLIAGALRSVYEMRSYALSRYVHIEGEGGEPDLAATG